LRAAKRRNGEVPPLSEEECRDENDESDRDVAKAAAMLDKPSDRATVGETDPVQRVGLGVAVVLGRALALGATVAGGTVADGI
jgi:hypothetical protein